MWVLRREPGCLFHKNAPHSITEKYLYFHTVRNLNFLSKNSTLRKIVELFWWLLVKMLRFWTFKLLTTLISREKWSKIWGKKLVKMLGIIDNFDWISRENCKVLSKLTFWTKKIDFSNSLITQVFFGRKIEIWFFCKRNPYICPKKCMS